MIGKVWDIALKRNNVKPFLVLVEAKEILK
jgi:hypothetical protein